MICKGKCVKYKVSTKHNPTHDRYSRGHKRCTICEIFIKWDGVNCPCCGVRLRVTPKRREYREKLRMKKQECTV